MTRLDRRNVMSGCLSLASMFVLAAAYAQAAAPPAVPWHVDLCLGQGGYWQKRVALVLRNPRPVAAEGEPVSVRVGKQAGKAGLAGAEMGAIRVCKADGTELLYRLNGPDGKKLTEGRVPEGAELVVPAEVPAGGEVTYYVYFDNPQAWPVPDFFKGEPKKPAPTGGAAKTPAATKPASAPASLSAAAGPVEMLALKAAGADETWPAAPEWTHRQLVQLANPAPADEDCVVRVDVSRLIWQARRQGLPADAQPRFMVTDGRAGLPCFLRDGSLHAAVRLGGGTLTRLYVYVQPKVAEPSGDGYAAVQGSPANLVRNGSFETLAPAAAPPNPGPPLPADWLPPPLPTQASIDDGGKVGPRCVKIQIPQNDKKQWAGWCQHVKVQPDKTYLYAAYVRCRGLRGGLGLHAHATAADGKLAAGQAILSVGKGIDGDADWTLLAGPLRLPPQTATLACLLTMNASGTAWHDGVLLAPLRTAAPCTVESRSASAGLAVWTVNPVVKVFREDLPPADAGAGKAPAPARITAAGNDREPLQIAIRGDKPIKQIRVQVEPPANAAGAKLAACTVAVVGYVPIDYRTNYYTSHEPAWHRMRPTADGSCDGWAGWWPDPLLPRDSFDLAAQSTQPVWVTVSVPAGAAPGDYVGKVVLTAEGKGLADLPFTVHVWDFALGEVSRCKAIYDVRAGHALWKTPGKSESEVWREMVRFMAERRLCPDSIQPHPKMWYRDGKVVDVDFSEFDRSAEFYFNELKLPHSYTPWPFYLFGWGLPPGDKFGQKAYEGEYPFEKADRSKLRPQYKEAFQACLRVYWEHLKAKGWDKRVLFYISDEPFYTQPQIVTQMKALCDMVHEVDKAIPIYCSTWQHIPAWDDYLDVWGIGAYGVVSVEKMGQLRKAGKRILWTTDGHLCTDTPYCAIERLLPHYAFQYGAEGYEFWGITWLTYDPYRFGWHAYIDQRDSPTNRYYVRYPNGDGFLMYPGSPIGHAGPVSSVRMEQAREGVEDYEYLATLADLVRQAEKPGGKAVPPAAMEQARAALEQARAAQKQAAALVSIPNAGGRFSTKILPDPQAVPRVKEAVAQAIEKLKNGR